MSINNLIKSMEIDEKKYEKIHKLISEFLNITKIKEFRIYELSDVCLIEFKKYNYDLEKLKKEAKKIFGYYLGEIKEENGIITIGLIII